MSVEPDQQESPDEDPIPQAREPSPLSADLAALTIRSRGKSLTVGELQEELKGRGIAMLLLLLALPFCFLPVPGLSTPFGVAVVLIGVRITLGQKPWLPGFIRNRRISEPRLVKVLAGGMRFARIMEKIVRPRMHFLHRYPGMINLIGAGIVSGGLLLLLPLPVPFSNTIPAWAVVLLAAGMMERDGLLVLLGHLMTLVSWAFIALTWTLGAKGYNSLFSLI